MNAVQTNLLGMTAVWDRDGKREGGAIVAVTWDRFDFETGFVLLVLTDFGMVTKRASTVRVVG